MSPRLYSAVALSLLALPAAARAQAQDGQPDAPDLHDRVVVTSSALRTLEADALQHIDVVTIDEIQDGFAGSLGDTLAALPGVSTTFFGPAAGRPVVRGLGGERTLVLSNGVGLIDASAVSPDHAVSSEGLEAERIDILRGSSALAYGGSAISGVVNVFDGTIPDSAPDGWTGRAYLGGESAADSVAAAASATGGAGPLVITGRFSVRHAEDYAIPGFAESARFRELEEAEEAEHEAEEEDHDEDHDEDEEHEHEEEEAEAYGKVPNSGYDFRSGAIGASLTGDWGFFGATVKRFESEYGLAGHSHAHEHEHEHEEGEDEDHEEEEDDLHAALEAAGVQEVPYIDMEQTRVETRGEFVLPFAAFDALRVSGAWADYAHTEFEAPGFPGTVFDSEGWEARAELVQAAQGGWTGASGAQVLDKDFSATGEEALSPPTTTQSVGLFTVQRYDAGPWGLEGGARWDSTTVDTPSLSRDFDAVSLSLGGFLRPASGLFVGVTAAHTERAPGDLELFANGPHAATSQFEVGDATLTTEKALTLEGIVRYDAGWIETEAALWGADYDGFIFLADTGLEEDGLPVFQQTQADASLWGAELGASAHLFAAGPWDIDADASVEYVHGTVKSGPDLPRLPPLSTTLGLEALRGDALALRAELVSAAAQTRTYPGELKTDPYNLVNLQATWRPMTDADLRVIAGVRNIFNEEARVHTSYLKDILPLPGRSVRLALAAGF